MLYFLQPILLWASAGIVVPILIHLWNVREGKTLKVGSIALFTEGAKSHARSLKLKELLLLLLRCLLLIVLVMLIAKPMLKIKEAQKKKGWIMIPQEELKSAYHTHALLIDSLLKTGYSFHYFDSGFGEVKFADALEKKNTTTQSQLSYWSLLRYLDNKKATQSPVYLFADGELQHWYGSRPQLSSKIKWYACHDADTTSTWMEAAYKTGTDSIRLVSGESNALGTKFTQQNLSFNSNDNQYKVQSENGKWFVRKLSTSQQIEIDTTAMRIAIYTKGYANDASYVRAAINAVKDFTQHNIIVTTTDNISAIPAQYSWLFWLSDEAIPQSYIRNNLLLYQGGQIQKRNSFLISDDMADNEKILIYKSIANDSASPTFQKQWEDGFGNPVLSLQKGSASAYHFYGRFNPQWNDLVWSNAFPQTIYQLLYKSEAKYNFDSHDKRLLHPSQIQAAFDKPVKTVAKQNSFQVKDLSFLFWILAFILLTLERIFSFHAKTGNA